MNYDEVIAVNEADEVLEYLDKMDAHRRGVLHRAISVFILNSRGEWLLQRRAAHKYHSGLLWTNASCTHPMKGESNLQAADRRLREEMGLKAPLKQAFSFIYRAELDNDLTENELDHVFIGHTDDEPDFNVEEVSEYKYMSVEELDMDMAEHPEQYTAWFKLLFPRVKEHLQS